MTEEDQQRRFNDTLFNTIKSRRGDDPEESYTAQLFAGGAEEISRKIGEEATEVIVAALRETPAHVVSESADLLYHLMVLWAHQDITPQDVFEELENRTGTSGIEEKESREDG